MTLHEWETKLAAEFQRAGFDQPVFETRRLLQAVLGLSDLEYLNTKNNAVGDENKIAEWAARRLKGEPLAYLEGQKAFYKFEFQVESGVLVPRPETEHVVEVALRRKPDAFTIADLGCGSGCIGLSLVHEIKKARLWAVDRSPTACRVTQANAQRLSVANRVTVLNVDVNSWRTDQAFDLIVANPPYIATGDPHVQKSVHEFEPHEALYSGANGTDAIENWSRWAIHHLSKSGMFVMEFGAGQSGVVRAIMEKQGFRDLAMERDLAGHDRVISGVKE